MNFHSNLRRALSHHLGLELTPEVASAIEVAAMEIPDRSIDPDTFEVKDYKGLTFGAERLRDIVDEIHPLHEQHFAETERHRLGFGLNVDYDKMLAYEKMGDLLQFTMRDQAGRLVGNIRMYLSRSMHTGTYYASEDTFYVLPEFRKGFTSLRFWQYMESCVQQLGIREIRTDSKVVNNVHRLNEYCGYTHVANKYVKIF